MIEESKKVKEFEDRHKSEIFNMIGEFSSKQSELILQIQKYGKYIDLESNLPNIGITLNNKLVELQRQFQDAGISIYSKGVEGLKEVGVVNSSLIGDAILSDLINYVSKGTQKLDNYSKEMLKVSKKKAKQVQGLEKASPIRSFFARIKNFFIPVKQEDISYTQEEIESINSHLSDYKDIDNQLWNYNLRDNIVSSVVKKIRERGYGANTVPELVETSIVPDLEKLGLADLIPQLQESLIEEYKKDLPEMRQIKEEDLHLYVPDFNSTTQNHGEVDTEEVNRHEKSKQIIEEAKKSLKKDGVSISDFYSIDKTVDASDRQSATSAIREELQPDLENNKYKTKESEEEISL
ncbi:MAG: hypothetical protein IJE05_00030 [Clostridia bacterium]|nr:hypothetical protein [Clostridia bacterium]